MMASLSELGVGSGNIVVGVAVSVNVAVVLVFWCVEVLHALVMRMMQLSMMILFIGYLPSPAK